MTLLNAPRSFHLRALEKLLAPIARYCVRHSVSIQDVFEVARVVFVNAARAELAREGEKINVSRVSLLTGLYRQDVHRLLNEAETTAAAPAEDAPSLLSRVIGQWEQNKRFTTKRGEPRVLNCGGEENEFRELCETVSSAVNSGTILYALLRNGSVERTGNKVRLVRAEFSHGPDREKAIDLLARDVATLIETVDENVENWEHIGNLHTRTEYDNVYHKHLYEIRRWLVVEGNEFHRRARDFISQFDKDVNPSADPNESAGAKVIVTAFSKTPVPQSPPDANDPHAPKQPDESRAPDTQTRKRLKAR